MLPPGKFPLPRWPLARPLDPEEITQREVVSALRAELSPQGVVVAFIGGEIRLGGKLGQSLQAAKSAMGAVDGIPDVLIVAPGGRSMFMEIKKPAERRMVVVETAIPGRGELRTRTVGAGQLSDAQRIFRDWARAADVPWAVARTTQEALVAVRLFMSAAQI